MAKGIAFEFLDVGQGDGTLVQMPPYDSGELWLVDFGKKSNGDVAVDDALKFLIQRITLVCKTAKLTEPWLDRLIITHPDLDHWNRVCSLIYGYAGSFDKAKTGRLWHEYSKEIFPNDPWPVNTTLNIRDFYYGGSWESYGKRAEIMSEMMIATVTGTNKKPKGYCFAYNQYTKAGTSWKTIGACKVHVLSSSLGSDSNPNPDSVVLMFSFTDTKSGVRKVILTGDAESKVVEPRIIERYKGTPTFLNSVALKLGHHGSDAATSAEWLDKVRPQVALASGDKRWGHPYEGPFTRATQYLTVPITQGLHRYCCSKTGVKGDNDYQNQQSDKGFCTNLWYVVKTSGGETLKGLDNKNYTEPQGTYTGVQWRVELNPELDTWVVCTPAWPVPVAS